MKRFVRLTTEEREQAVLNRLGSILDGLVTKKLTLNDEQNGNNAQEVIDALVQQAFDAGDPKQAVKFIMEAVIDVAGGKSAFMREFLLELAEEEAKTCWYRELYDRVLVIEEDDGHTTIRG